MTHTLGPVNNAALMHQLRANGEEELTDLIAQNGVMYRQVLSRDLSSVVEYSQEQLEAILKATEQVQAAAE